MALLNRGIIFLVVVMAAAELIGNAGAVNYVVGDSLGWRVPPGGAADYATWASQHTFRVGDVLVFNFNTGLHSVAEVGQGAYDACTSTNPIALTTIGPASFVLNSTGPDFYICTFGQHCSLGQKLTINVTSSTPTPAPIPPTIMPQPSAPVQSPPATLPPSSAPAQSPPAIMPPPSAPAHSPPATMPAPSSPTTMPPSLAPVQSPPTVMPPSLSPAQSPPTAMPTPLTSPSRAPSPTSASSPAPSSIMTPPMSQAPEGSPVYGPSAPYFPPYFPAENLNPPPAPPPSAAAITTIHAPIVIFVSIIFGLMV